MGTLFDQSPRQETLDSYAHTILSIARNAGFDTDNMTPAEWHAACDLARTALAIQSADALDEQLAGLGHILQQIAGAIEGVAK
jgi:hypothetical protein